jgi:hypothetical protein
LKKRILKNDNERDTLKLGSVGTTLQSTVDSPFGEGMSVQTNEIRINLERTN